MIVQHLPRTRASARRRIHPRDRALIALVIDVALWALIVVAGAWAVAIIGT